MLFRSPELSPNIDAFICRCQLKGYLPSIDDSPFTEIKKFSGQQEPLNNTTASSTTMVKHRGFEASHGNEVISSTSPPLQSIAHTLSRTEVVCHIAKQVVEILHKIGVDCAIFGSLGCYLYGNDRSPNVGLRPLFISLFFSLTDSFVYRTLILLPFHQQISLSRTKT